MPYELDFREKALKEWKALDNSVREILKKKLEARLANPFVPNDALGAELFGCYSLRHHKTGHRLVYRADAETKILLVLAVGPRDDLQAYQRATERLYD